MASPLRIDRVRSRLLREVSDIVMHLQDPRLRLVNVTDVELAKDFSYATLFISLIGSKEEQQQATQALESARGYLRREVARRINLCHTPELRLAYDDTAERAARVWALIDGLGKKADG
jgi:ribosome-binding factor A